MAGFINSSGTDYHFKKINVSVDKLSTNSTYVSSYSNDCVATESVDLDNEVSDNNHFFAVKYANSISNMIKMVIEDTKSNKTDPTLVDDLNQEHETTVSTPNNGYEVYEPTEPVYYDNDSHTDTVGVGSSFISIPADDKCYLLSGSCETDDYIIVSYKDKEDENQKIVIYSKKDNKPIKTIETEKLGHTNGLTTDGKKVYIANGTPSNQISFFDIKEIISKDSGTDNIKVERFSIGSDKEKISNFTAIGYDSKSGVVVSQCGEHLYIVNKGKLIKVKKIDYKGEFADSNQDICVAKDSIYVIRDHTHCQGLINKDGDMTFDGSHNPDEYNVIDVYDLDGNYKYTKKVSVPVVEGDDGPVYRELESISFDGENFTLYFNNPFENTSSPHVIVRGVDIEGSDDILRTNSIY